MLLQQLFLQPRLVVIAARVVCKAVERYVQEERFLPRQKGHTSQVWVDRQHVS